MSGLISRKLGGLFQGLLELSGWSVHQAGQAMGEENTMQVSSAARMSGVMATMVSVVAMVFSGFSFYETALKQANMVSYPPVLMHMYREGFTDILAIPVSISNDGAQRGTILSFNLKVTNLKTNETREFQNIYFGDNPKGQKTLFSPITIPGRSSYSGVVLFRATKAGSFSETTGPVKVPLRLSLSMNTDGSNAFLGVAKTTPLTFDMTANYIESFGNMERGQATSFYNTRWNAADLKEGTASAR